MNAPKDYKTVNVQLPADLFAQAWERAEAEDRPVSNLMRVALRFYLQESTP